MKKRGRWGVALMGSLLVALPLPVLGASDEAVTTSVIEFSADEFGESPIIDPETKEPVEPVVPGGSTSGALRLDHVSQLSFGKTNKIVSKEQRYYAEFDQMKEVNSGKVIQAPSFVQVTDERGGTKGWSVNVTHDGVFKTASGKHFTNAKLTLSGLGLSSGSGIVDPLRFPVMASGDVNISTGDAVRLLTADAEKEQGYGVWVMRFGSTATQTSGKGFDGNDPNGTGPVDATKVGRNPGVRLTLPAGTVLDPTVAYSSSLIWEIASAY